MAKMTQIAVTERELNAIFAAVRQAQKEGWDAEIEFYFGNKFDLLDDNEIDVLLERINTEWGEIEVPDDHP